MKVADMKWVDFDVKRKMKRTFTDAAIRKYIFGEEYKADPKEHKKLLESDNKRYKKTIEEYAKKRQAAVDKGETDEEFLDHIYGAGFYYMQLAENEKKLAEGDYLQTPEDFAYRKEWMARYCFWQASVQNNTRAKKRWIEVYEPEYNFKSEGYDWDARTGVLKDEDALITMCTKQDKAKFRKVWG